MSHISVAKKRARCEANTFDGERCIYGALYSEIRNLLRNFKVISSQTIRRELYHEFLRRLLECGHHADVRFIVHGVELLAHKCVLVARSEYFYEMFSSRWRFRNVVQVNHPMANADAFRAVLSYLYTEQLEAPIALIEDIVRLAKQCKLNSLVSRLESRFTNADFFQTTKPGVRVTSVLVEAPQEGGELAADMALLAEEALPPAFALWVQDADLPSFFKLDRPPTADVIFLVDEHRFYCHRAFFCGRSEYFRILVSDPLNEPELHDKDEDSGLDVVHLRQFTPTVFLAVLNYIYKESVEFDEDMVYDVLVAADISLLPGLKRLCGTYISQLLDTENVTTALRTARMFDLGRLEDQCCLFIADHLEQMIDNSELHMLIMEDAGNVQGREDVDSIDVIDNVRYHLTAQSMDEAHDKLQLIDHLLISLGLEA
uniref:BTB domain-containing protein n=1 Tax=Plectus sambesii TaxID=2011161 RepID=A0A914WAR9_9BILA